jgi:hypothetical protein
MFPDKSRPENGCSTLDSSLAAPASVQWPSGTARRLLTAGCSKPRSEECFYSGNKYQI